jgi:hypothetical protein
MQPNRSAIKKFYSLLTPLENPHAFSIGKIQQLYPTISFRAMEKWEKTSMHPSENHSRSASGLKTVN